MLNRIQNTKSVKALVGNRIQEARKPLYKTRSALCNKLSDYDLTIEEGTLRAWETGTNAVPIERIPALCDALQCDAGYLFGEYDEKTRQIADIVKETGLAPDVVSMILKADGNLISQIVISPKFEPLLNSIKDARWIAEEVQEAASIAFGSDEDDDPEEKLNAFYDLQDKKFYLRAARFDATEKLAGIMDDLFGIDSTLRSVEKKLEEFDIKSLEATARRVKHEG